MNRKGVCYDVGSVMGFNWRPNFKPEQVRRELQIIKDDLHCNAVRISGRDLGRLEMASGDALEQGQRFGSLRPFGTGAPKTLSDTSSGLPRRLKRSGTRKGTTSSSLLGAN